MDRPLLRAKDGSRYYDGVESLVVVDVNWQEREWPLPDTAVGVAPVTLIEAADGRLFLFNQPGRVLRLKTTPNEAEPFKIEATFTDRVPNGEPNRIWLDPAGRIVMAMEGRLAILFPQGFIPTAIRRMMDVPEDDELE